MWSMPATDMQGISFSSRVCRLYGAVTAADISDTLKASGFEIEKKKVVINNPIKNTGIFSVRVKLHPKVSADINVEVVVN